MDGQQIQLNELAIIFVFVFTQPLMIAFVIQSWFFATRSDPATGRLSRALLACALTTIGSLIIGALVFEFAPRSFGPVLGIKDITIAGQDWTVMPLAFITVAIVAPIVTLWIAQRETKQP